MKRMSRLVATLVSMALLVTLLFTGCGTKEQNASGTTTSTNAEQTTLATETKEKELTDADKIAKYDPAITLTTIKKTDTGYMFPEGDSIENNAYLRFIEEKLGIKIKYNWVVDVSQWDNKLSLMFASNEMPDFFDVDNKNFTNLVSNDSVMDITDVHQKWTTEQIKSFDTAFQEGFDSAFVNGKQFGITGLGFGEISLPEILWIRNDWLQQSGMQAPKTMADLEALALKFMEQHKGSYGLAVNKELADNAMGITAIANGYNAFFRNWIKKDGQIAYGSIQPEMKQTLTTLQDWYKKGIIHKEFGVKDANKVIEDLTSGKVGIMSGANWNGWWPLTDSVEKDKADWLAFDVPTVNGELANLQAPWPVSAYTVINKDCKNPEAVIKMMNLFAKTDKEGGFNEKKFTEISAWCYPVQQSNPNSTEIDYKVIKAALESEDTSKLTFAQKTQYDDAVTWKKDKTIRGYGRYIQQTSAFPTIQKYVDNKKIIMTELRGADPEGYAAIKATLKTLELNAFTKIIMGGSMDEFNQFVEKWNSMGGEAATKEINALYNK